jgi:YidC/Oxa1 family membrane protein insertase
MMNLLLATIVFPPDGNLIEKFVFNLLEWIMGWGWVSYGFAIIIFTIFIKLIMLPLDFINRYFTKKNQIVMAKIAPEEKALRETYASDPMALQKARQELYRKQNVGQGGFCLVMLINLVVTLTVFFSVFSGLRAVANYNISQQVLDLRREYMDAVTESTTNEEIAARLNKKYEETRVSFLWVKNIWQPDTWSKEIMTHAQYAKAIEKYGDAITEAEYNTIFGHISAEHNGWGGLHWNGMLLLVFLAGGTTYLSTWLSTLLNKKSKPQEKTGTKAEPIISYSLRDAKTQSGGSQPDIDPAQITKMMQIIMPVVMVTFAISSTAAMSIYIIASSVVSTGLTLSLGLAVDEIIKRQKPKQAKEKGFDPTVINPHAKYFKDKGSSKK